MKFSVNKIQEILKNFSRSLEQRDREDMKLYGWKDGDVSTYRSRYDDVSVEEDREE